MSMTITIVDLALHAASKCHGCRTIGRPVHECTQEHGDTFHHTGYGTKFAECHAGQVWELIVKLEADTK